MPLSTSNFKRPVPTGDWKTSCWVSLGLVLLIMLGWEAYWRGQEYAPTLNETHDLWAQTRTRLKSYDSPDDTVIIGSSRIQFDFDLDVYAEHFKRVQPLQLALPGTTPLPILEHLAYDTDFSGHLLCGVTPGLYFVPGGMPVILVEKAIKRYRNWAPSQRSGHFLAMLLQHRLAFLQHDDLTLKLLLPVWFPLPNRANIQIPPPLPPYFYALEPNRRARMWQKLDFNSPMAAKVQNAWHQLCVPPPPPPGADPEEMERAYMASVESYLERSSKAVKTIQKRGGSVVFIRCPSTEWVRELENKHNPRASFWEKLLERSGAAGIHFEDHPELASFKCPEWSHLTNKDATLFTQRLMPILEKALAKSEP